MENIQRHPNSSHLAIAILSIARCPPLFRAFTGCDTVSALFRLENQTVWNAWRGFSDITDTLVAITQNPTSLSIDSHHMRCLERWTVLMYTKN